ncbi:zinc-dependent metalloprotease [Corynebacterium mendelii]|uniref:Zinc-dependent metalloprotease n=1 Tax=Corynebacterium mendelii TaxID=2765362 RepID=A0A939E027_9CORY|nr:zinc-dependent metalloprotease [Corynebacterium mendelii]MBN9644440.1 zinc-dependent metalloprotease [Corynebacterium mendelii]
MASNGFGFTPRDDDDDDDRRKDDNPFSIFGFGAPSGGGSLGDMLNQFGQMLSGVGSTMNNSDGGAVNYQLAEKIALQEIGSPAQPSPAQSQAVEEAVRLADVWMDGVTDLPSSGAQVVAWSPKDWLHGTLDSWKRFVTPVAERMNEAQLESLPEQAREMVGPMLTMMNQMSGMNSGMQLGSSLGELAGQVISGCDMGLPVAPKNTVALLPQRIISIAKEVGCERRDLMIYVAAREAARQRLFTHVPWLTEQLVSSVEEYARGLVIDTSHIEDAARELNLESGEPTDIQDAIGKLQSMDLSPRISSRNAGATTRLETLLALVEGWVDHVVGETLGERIPSTPLITEAFTRRRATGGSADKAMERIVGITISAPKIEAAANLWQRATTAVGGQRRDAVWDHPDFLPDADDLDHPAAFIDRLLDDADGDDFDPIAEINALEEELARKAEEEKQQQDSTDSTDDGDTGDDNADGDDKS